MTEKIDLVKMPLSEVEPELEAELEIEIEIELEVDEPKPEPDPIVIRYGSRDRTLLSATPPPQAFRSLSFASGKMPSTSSIKSLGRAVETSNSESHLNRKENRKDDVRIISNESCTSNFVSVKEGAKDAMPDAAESKVGQAFTEENEEKKTSDSQNGASQETNDSLALLPRSFSDSSPNDYSPKKLMVDLSLPTGSRSPSVLSSQEEYSSKDSEETEKSLWRMKHLSFLLDQHHKKLSGSVGSDAWVEDDSLGNTSDEQRGEGSSEPPKRTAKQNKTKSEKKEMMNKTMDSTEHSNSAGTYRIKKKQDVSSSLFENFDKTWSNIHSRAKVKNGDIDMDTQRLSRERLCFATMVHILLKEYQFAANGSKTMWNNDISIDVVKMFWKRVILPQCEHSSEIDFEIDGIVQNLTEKLRYLVQKTSILYDGTPSTKLQLSHEVYAQYAKYIFECDGITQDQIDEWNVSFVGELQNILLAGKIGSESQAHAAIRMYAITNLPTCLLKSLSIVMTSMTQDSSSRKAYEHKRLSELIILMRNQKFLSLRMNMLGNKRLDDSDVQRKKNPSRQMLEKRWDVLGATSLHVKDLEMISSVISKKVDDNIVVGDYPMDVTRAAVVMFAAWKEVCYTIMTKARNLINSYHNDSVISDIDSLDGCILNLAHNSQLASRRFKRSNSYPIQISYSDACLVEKPNIFQVSAGEYEFDEENTKIRLLVRNNHGSTVEKKFKTSSLKKQQSQENKPTMKLCDILNIDVDLLNFETTVGKAFFLIGESLASITSSKTSTHHKSARKPVGWLLTGPLGCTSKLNYCAAALETYIRLSNAAAFLLSDELKDVDEDDLVDLGYNYEDTNGADPSTRMKKMMRDRIEAKLLMEHLDVLISEGFFALGNHILCGIHQGQTDVISMAGISILNRLDQSMITVLIIDKISNEPVTEDAFPSLKVKVLQCYQLALQFLRVCPPDVIDDELIEELMMSAFHFDNSKEVSDNDVSGVKLHERILQTSILHAIGVHYYEQIGDCTKAKYFLSDCCNKRQQLLRQLRNDDQDSGNISSSSAGSSIPVHSRRRSSLTDSSSILSTRHGRRKAKAKSRRVNDPRSANVHSTEKTELILGNGMTTKEHADSIELELSSTMEFSALASHGQADSEAALALFQEALIIRALHTGKNSLDVSDLQYNLGVLHDDLGQYEASLGRYGESLRVRFSHLEQIKMENSASSTLATPPDRLVEVESSVVLTLRCMANVYRALEDYSNAISSNLKAVELLKDHLKRRSSLADRGIYSQDGSVLGFGKMKGKLPPVPLPKIILGEMKSASSQNSLPTIPLPPDTSGDIDTSDDDTTRNEISSIYSTILVLLDQLKERGENNGGYGSSTPSSRTFLTDHHSISNVMGKRGINPDHVRIETSFNLGLIAMYFGEHKNALTSLEEALRTLWTSFPGESSGESSDSDLSSSNNSADSSEETRPKSRKVYIEGQAEEGILYHSLAICHSALGDDDRAIRCYITALRYYRRRFGVMSMIVSGALYDCATSYWNISDYAKAEDFWADCLRILLSQGIEASARPFEIQIARALYNIAASKICLGEYFNQYTTTCLEDALSIFTKTNEKGEGQLSEEVAHVFFNLSLIHYNRYMHRTSSKKLHICDLGSDRSDDLKSALAFVDDALNAYISGSFETSELVPQADIGQNVQHPMQALVAYVNALIHDAMGSVTQAVWNYKTAIRLLNKVYSPQNLYSASALFNQGDLLIGIGEVPDALKSYEESLSIRISVLGGKDQSIADTLFKIAGIIDQMSQHEKSLDMLKECLQIRLESEGKDGSGVAEILFNIGLIYNRLGHLKKSIDYLHGAMNVRKNRINAITICKEQYSEDTDTVNSYKNEIRMEESELASILHHIGNIHLKLEDVQTAMTHYEDAMKGWRKLCDFGSGGFAEYAQREDIDRMIDENRDILRDMADTLHNMGGVYETNADFSRGLGCYNQALVMKRSLLEDKEKVISQRPQSSPLDDFIVSSKTLSSAITLLRIGAIHVVLHNYDVSLSYYKSALRIQRQHLGRDHIAVAQTLYEIGTIMRHRLKYAPVVSAEEIVGLEKAAVKYFKDSLQIAKNRYGSNHEVVATVMYDIGSIHDRKGDYQEAILCYQQAVRVYGRVYAQTLCRKIFDISPNDGARLNTIVENDHGLFHPTALNSSLSNPFGSPLKNLSKKESLSMSVNDKDREAYLKASLALANAATRSGLIIGNNQSVIEITLFKLVHYFIKYGIDPLRGTVKRTLKLALGQVQKASSDAIVTSQDVTSDQFLYLIQD